MLICQVCSICIWFMYLWFFKFVHCIMKGLLYGMDGIDHKMRKKMEWFLGVVGASRLTIISLIVR